MITLLLWGVTAFFGGATIWMFHEARWLWNVNRRWAWAAGLVAAAALLVAGVFAWLAITGKAPS